VSQTIWDGYPGGQARASVQQAEITLRSRSLADAADRRDLALKVSQAYYAVLSAQRTLGLRQDAVAQRELEEKRALILSEGGTASALEVTQAGVNLRGARIDLQAALSALASARRTLSLLAGWQPDSDYEAGEAPDPAVPTLETPALVQEALSRRADLQQAALAVRTGEIVLALKKAQSSPAITASAGADYSRGWESGTDLLTWSLAVRGSIPIVDSGLAAAQAAEASAQDQAARIAAESLAARIASEVEQKAASVRELRERAELARSSLELSRMQAELAELKFQQGAGTQMEALAASVAVSNARAALEKARSDAQLAVLELQNAVGL
jgi:outer membrane protein TolC